MNGSKRALAAGVSILGVLLIWAVATSRQEEQTRAVGRQWIGEQWDIARRCVVGTPIGRRDAEAAIADRLAAVAVDTLASAAGEEADPARLWPARCAPLLRGLRADPSITGGTDVTRLVAELEALARHALAPRDVAGTLSRARAMAGPIRALDAAMPPGAEYDPAHFEAPRADPAPIEASLRCREAPAPTAAPCVEASALSPSPPGAFVAACDGDRAVAMWRTDAGWVGSICTPECRPVPALAAGEDLQLALAGARVVAVGPGAGGDLPLASSLDGGAWSAPVPVPRGRLAPSGDAITACGERWTFTPP